MNNTLISMYSKFGHIGLARYLFDKMRERHEASWNNMMSGYVRAEFYAEAIAFFNKMSGFGTKPSGFAVASLVTACDRSGCMFDEGVQVHGFVLKFGLLSDVFVGTSLLHFCCVYVYVVWYSDPDLMLRGRILLSVEILDLRRNWPKGKARGRHLKSKIEELSNEAYFSKNNEFAAWLKEETKLFFSDLSSEHARELFSDFIKDWNDLKSLNRDTMRASQVVLGVLIT
ncbi:hypothetical protein Tsubulata_013152, partial [Turnera subulata]